MSVSNINDNRAGRRDGAREAQGAVAGELPDELIQLEAYYRWQRRCLLLGRIVHGGDRVDWLEAEVNVAKKWSDLTSDDVDKFYEMVSLSRLVPSRERVAVRAYFKSIAEGNQTSEEANRNWAAAESEEITILFAEAFYRFLAHVCPTAQRAGQLVSPN